MKKISTKKIDIYYEDTDASGLTYHTSYLKFAERARSDILKKKFPEIVEFSKKNLYFFVAKSINVNFIKPAFLYDTVHIDTFYEKSKFASLFLKQIIKKDNSIITDISLRLVWLKGTRKVPDKIPNHIIARFKSMEVV